MCVGGGVSVCSVWGVVGVREPHVCTLMCYSYAQSNNTMEVQRQLKCYI